MPVIFQGQPGRVLAIKDPAVPSEIRPLVQPDPSIDIQSEKSIITNVAINQQTNHQFLHTLGNDIYVYVFGDRIGQINIMGFSFMETCGGSGGGNGQHGLELMLNWYKRNKLSSRKEPVKVAIGAVTFTAFVTGIQTQVQDPKLFLTSFNVSMALIPEKNDEGGGDPSGGAGTIPVGAALSGGLGTAGTQLFETGGISGAGTAVV